MRVSQTQRSRPWPENMPNRAVASMIKWATIAMSKFAPGRPDRRAKLMKRSGVVSAQFTKRSHRTWRMYSVSVSGTCLWRSCIVACLVVMPWPVDRAR